MEMNKIVNLDAEELALQLRQASEQLFRLRFQFSMGQNEGLKKYHGLKKDVARIRTVERQRELGIYSAGNTIGAESEKVHKKPTKSRSKSAVRAKRLAGRSAGKSTKRAVTQRSRSANKVKSAGRAGVVKRGKANAQKGS